MHLELHLQKRTIMNDFIEIGGYALFVIIAVVATFFSITAEKGLTDKTFVLQYTVYSTTIFLFLIYVSLVTGLHRIGAWRHMIGFVHSPELSPLGRIKVFARPLHLILIFLGVFLTLAFVTALTPQTAVGKFYDLPSLQLQQVTASGKASMIFFASISENAWLFTLMFLTMSLFVWLLLRFNIVGKVRTAYAIAILPTIAIVTPIWAKIHILATQSELGMVAHMKFAALGSTLVLATGSIFPLSIYHLVNNIFVRIKSEFSNEIVAVVFGVVLFIYIISIIAYFVVKNKKMKEVV